jgi:hypothetical protein
MGRMRDEHLNEPLFAGDARLLRLVRWQTGHCPLCHTCSSKAAVSCSHRGLRFRLLRVLPSGERTATGFVFLCKKATDGVDGPFGTALPN